MERFIAHSQNQLGVSQPLAEHLHNVAGLAAQFASFYGAEKLGYYLGLWHDLGKYHADVQKYLNNPASKRGPGHKTAGAVFALKFLEILAFPIIGHHGGIPGKTALQQRIKDALEDCSAKEAIAAAEKDLPAVYPDAPLKLPKHISESWTSLEFFIRMLFSALVDGDFLDTEAHFAFDKHQKRRNKQDIRKLWDVFKNNYPPAGAESSKINQLRLEMYRACTAAAEKNQGIFKLTMPTGGGKTLAGMGFALKHAVRHNLRRVIVAIPYTGIIEQNADVYRGIFGSDAVLEHHSAVADNLGTDNSDEETQTFLQLAAENWDAPIIVTTAVQLFESLFHHKPSRCRKLHNIANSVIILDEVQTLPVEVLTPILDVLQELVNYYGVTVVLSTATQPALTGGPYLKGLSNVQEIIPQPAKYFNMLKRVEYVLPAGRQLTWAQVAAEMRSHRQCLTVVNTKKDAVDLLQQLNDPDALHLSTLLCGAHRRSVLSEVKERLSKGKPCRLVSTQVIEAGVDVDFPVVMRAVGPLDRIVQAAGRCNREGRLTAADGTPMPGKVIIFDPADGGLPSGAYRAGTTRTKTMLNSQAADLHNPQIYEEYFQSFYQLVETDVYEIQEQRKKLEFSAAAERFRLIADNTVPVVVRWKQCSGIIDELIADIESQRAVTRAQMRRLQPFLVNIYQNQLPRLLSENFLVELVPGLYRWLGDYHDVYGLIEKNIDPEELIF